MRISTLATVSAGVVGVSALSSFGTRLGRDAHHNFGNIVLFVAAMAIGLGAFILPYLAMVRLFSWYPIQGARYFFTIIVKWTLVLAVGIGLLYGLAWFAWLCTNPPSVRHFESLAAQKEIARNLAILGALPVMLGTFVGLRRRRAQEIAYMTAALNQKFLDDNGIQEYPGSRFSHVDGHGNKLSLVGQTKEFLTFMTDSGDDAFIKLSPTGRFVEYSVSIP